jgi:hypothetical protein
LKDLESSISGNYEIGGCLNLSISMGQGISGEEVIIGADEENTAQAYT